MILVSACLIGVNCKYNGGNNFNNEILQRFKEVGIIPVCPEQLGGLSTPRTPAEIYNGDGKDVLEGVASVITKDGKDVTEEFIKGARETLRIAQSQGVTNAILKARSPSCGKGKIYDGAFSGTLKQGDGVTTALLKIKGINVFSENDFHKMKV